MKNNYKIYYNLPSSVVTEFKKVAKSLNLSMTSLSRNLVLSFLHEVRVAGLSVVSMQPHLESKFVKIITERRNENNGRK